jgi:hypothetical protein
MSGRSYARAAGLTVTLVLGLVVATAGRATAAPIVVAGDGADVVIENGGSMVDATVFRVGASPLPPGPGARTAVFVFQLPDPPKPGQVVSSAAFEFTVVGLKAGATYNLDLYGLPARDAPDVVDTDNFFGARDATATLIQDNLVTAALVPMGTVDTSPAAAPALVAYLNAQYASAGAGAYVFLRLNPDASPPLTEDTGVQVAFADNDTGQPQLTLDFATAPEPSGLALASASALAALARRRRRRQRANGGVARVARP